MQAQSELMILNHSTLNRAQESINRNVVTMDIQLEKSELKFYKYSMKNKRRNEVTKKKLNEEPRKNCTLRTKIPNLIGFSFLGLCWF